MTDVQLFAHPVSGFDGDGRLVDPPPIEQPREITEEQLYRRYLRQACGIGPGDGICNCGETRCNAPAECGAPACNECGPHCGNGKCDCGETKCDCPGDCGASVCNDALCCPNEFGCPECYACSDVYCGDGVCCPGAIVLT